MSLFTTCRQKLHVRIIGGSLGMSDKSGVTKSTGLTPKQLHFARCVASGMSQAAAYREAYGCSPDSKPETQQANASRLMADSRVRARVDAIIRQKEAGIAASAASDREKVLSKLRHMLENAEPSDSNKLRAAELLGKTVGLFRDVVETSDTRSSNDLLSDLEKLLETSQPEPEQPPPDQPLH